MQHTACMLSLCRILSLHVVVHLLSLLYGTPYLTHQLDWWACRLLLDLSVADDATVNTLAHVFDFCWV